MKHELLSQSQIIEIIQNEFGQYLGCVTSSIDGIIIRLKSETGKLVPPFEPLPERKINTRDKILQKINHIKFRAFITEGFKVPSEWENVY